MPSGTFSHLVLIWQNCGVGLVILAATSVVGTQARLFLPINQTESIAWRSIPK